MTPEVARVAVPGHVTGLFCVHRQPDPRMTGSRGAGITLTDGATVVVDRDGPPGLKLDGTATEMEPVTRVLDALDAEPAIRVETAVPLGAGFGVSGAVALGTAIGVNAVYGCGRTDNELTAIAHAAEVEAGTGLGDVVAQARGGVPIRREPGAPPHGRLDGIPAGGRIEYLTFGELSTAAVIGGDTAAIDDAGAAALDAVLADPTLSTLMAASRTFAREAELLSDEVARAIDRVADAGGEAAMAMLGDTVFALGNGLSDAGYEPAACTIAHAGVRIEPGSGFFS